MQSLLTILYLLFYASLTQAQWQLNGVAVCDTIGNQHVAANGILSDGAGGAFVVWGDNRDGWDIYAQHVDSSGLMLWGKQGKPICTYPGWQFAPRVAPDGEGGFVAAWHDTRNDGRDVYAQRVDKDGDILWDPDGLLVVHAEQFQGIEDILFTADSCFIISWTDGRLFPDTSFVYVQKLNKNGQLLWDSTGIKVSNKPWGDSRLVSDLEGGAVVIWAGSNSENLLAQRLNRDGESLWTNSGIIASFSNASQGNTDLSVCSDGYGGAYIAWDYSKTDHSYIQRIDSIGNRLWGDNGIQINSNEITQQKPFIYKFHSDSVLYLWQDNYYIRMQIFSKEGKRKYTPLGLRLTNYKTSRYISSIYDQGKILISHPEIINFFPNEFIIKAQKTNTSGHLFWDSCGVVVSKQIISPNEVRGFSVSDGTGGIITAWDDDRKDNVETDIYIQRVYSNGKVGGDTTTSINYTEHFLPKKFDLKVYPNPFNNKVNIKFILQKNTVLQLSVFDINGCKIWGKNKEYYYAGIHKTAWDAQNNQGKGVSTGIYFIAVSGKESRLLRKALLIK